MIFRENSLVHNAPNPTHQFSFLVPSLIFYSWQYLLRSQYLLQFRILDLLLRLRPRKIILIASAVFA